MLLGWMMTMMWMIPHLIQNRKLRLGLLAQGPPASSQAEQLQALSCASFLKPRSPSASGAFSSRKGVVLLGEHVLASGWSTQSASAQPLPSVPPKKLAWPVWQHVVLEQFERNGLDWNRTTFFQERLKELLARTNLRQVRSWGQD